MRKTTSRLWSLIALLAVLIATGFAGQAEAQNLTFPTPTKTLCLGEPSASSPGTCNPTTPLNTPPPGIPVFYAITLAPNATGNFTLLETLPPSPGFSLLGANCTVVGSNQWMSPPPGSSVSGAVTSLGPISLQAGQNVTCFISGIFTNPGAAVSNSVTVADASGTAVSSAAGNNAVVATSATFPSDLKVEKTVSPTAVDVSAGPQTVTYTVVMTNNGPQPVSIGPIAQLFDKLSTTANSVPLQATLVPGSITCTASPSGLIPVGVSPPNTACLNPIPAGGGSGTNTITTTPFDFAKWYFPATGGSATGYIPAGGTITLTYQVEIRRHPDLFCAKGGEGVHNEVFFGLTRIDGLTITETDSTNNTAASADVAVTTGQEVDPDCGLPMPGPITITKQQLTPSPSTPVNWGSNVTYRVTVTNSDPNPIIVRLRDRVMEWAGTPQFSATVVNWTCNPTTACPSPTLFTPNLWSYFSTATVWDEAGITVPGSGGTVQLDITLNYVRKSCDSFAIGGDIIRNIGRANYTFGGAAVTAEAFVDTIMAPSPPCNFQVTKTVDHNKTKLEFGVPLVYTVDYHNAENTWVNVGTVIDAMRIVQPNYASQLSFTSSYTCTVTAGSVGGPGVPTTGSVSGNIVYTSNPAQGVRVIQNTLPPANFGPNSTLHCVITLTVNRPPPGDPYCMSAQEARFENLALMDVSNWYNPNLPWPPSETYNPANPVGTSQPSALTNWKTLSLTLPKCYQLVVNKTVNPTVTWPGGPPLTYTITVTNAGDTLTGAMANDGWHGILLGDHFTLPPNLTPTGVNVTSSCANPSATWQNWSGAPAGWLSFLPVINFPAGCTIKITFTLPGPYHQGQICNTGFAGMAPENSPDWYVHSPTPNLLESNVCVPVLETKPLIVSKVVNNTAGVPLLPGMTYQMNVSCTMPNPGGTPAVLTTASAVVNVPAGGSQTVNNIPVGSTCTVTENNWANLPVWSLGNCKLPDRPTWQPPVYSPPNYLIGPLSADPQITVTNTLKCVTPPINTLVVSKTFDPPSLVTQLPSTATFPVQVACNPAPNTTVTLTPTALQQFVGSIPVGTSCHITELPPQNTNVSKDCTWTASYPGGDTIVIPAQGTPTLEVKNRLTCKPDLAITKTGPVATGYSGLYAFTITVTSPGGPFTIPSGTLSVTDTLNGLGGGALSGMTATPSNVWNCTTAPLTGSCNYTGTGPTAAGQVLGTFTIYYFAFMPTAYVNCATVALSATAGVLENNLANNMACVPVGTFPRADLKIQKTGPVAVPGSPGLAAFTLTVTNAGGAFVMPLNGLTVTDTATGMPGSFAGISASPAGWTCGVTGATGSCSYAGGSTITAGQVLGTITITYYPTLLAEFTNCATVAIPNTVPLVDSVPTNNTSCVNVSNAKRITVSTPPTCDPATTISRGNACACRFGNMTRVSDFACTCPAGATFVAGKGCVRSVECRAPMIANAAGTGCACPPGMAQRGRECVKVPECLPPMIAGPAGCACPAGTTQRGRECVKAPECRPPMIPSPAGAGCMCPPGTTQRGRDCVKTQACTPPMVANAAGGCSCPPGTQQRGRECVKAGGDPRGDVRGPIGDPRKPTDPRGDTRGSPGDPLRR